MSNERDPHLLAALRHAPDRDALPPPELSARILAAARDAVRPRPTASPWARFANWWVQPQAGAALATLALATLLGVMWSTHEPPAPTSVPAPTPPAGERMAGPPRSAEPLPAVPAMPLAPPTTLPEPRAEPRTGAQAERRQTPAREAAAKAATDVAPAPSAAPPPPAETAVTKTDAAAPAPPPAMAAAPAPLAEPVRRARDERADRTAATNEAGALAAGRAAAPATLSLAARPPLDPLPALDATGPQAWTWSGSALTGERAHGEVQGALWAALREATQGRWQPATATPVPWLVLQHGAQRSMFWLADGALYLVDAQGRTWRAPISAEQARDWQQAVRSW